MHKLPKTTLSISEDEEQRAFVAWLDIKGLKYSAIPNSTYTTSWSVKNRNTAMGVRPGVPDMMIVLPTIGLVFIELKRQKGGVVSSHQRDWIAALNTCPGVAAHVCHGAAAAIAVIERYLTSP